MWRPPATSEATRAIEQPARIFFKQIQIKFYLPDTDIAI